MAFPTLKFVCFGAVKVLTKIQNWLSKWDTRRGGDPMRIIFREMEFLWKLGV